MTWTWQERRQPRRRRRPQSSRACLPAGRAARRSALTARTSPFTRCIDGRCKPPSTHARRADDDDDDDNGDDRHDADEDDDDGEDDDDDGGGGFSTQAQVTSRRASRPRCATCGYHRAIAHIPLDRVSAHHPRHPHHPPPRPHHYILMRLMGAAWVPPSPRGSPGRAPHGLFPVTHPV